MFNKNSSNVSIEYKDNRVTNLKWYTIFLMIGLTILPGLYFLIMKYKNVFLIKGIYKIGTKYFWVILITNILLLVLCTLFLIFLFYKTKRIKFDHWMPELAAKKVSSSRIFYDKKNIFIEYDISLTPKDLKEFCTAINDKSENFTYYYLGNNVDKAVFKVGISKKASIPKQAILEHKKDTVWNFIPLGETVDDELQAVVPVGWYLNKENKAEGVMDFEASTSILIAGGTGSGKSVQEVGIIGHCSRFPDNFQLLLADPKKVEFGPIRHVESCKLVAIETETIAELIKKMQEIMMNRFRFMESRAENNVYKLIGEPVDYYQFPIPGFDKPVQFDELIHCRIDGKTTLITAEEVYKEFEFQKDPNYKKIREAEEQEKKRNKRRW